MREQTLSPDRCADLIRSAERAVALCGAGVSTAAGIPDFRGVDGLYARAGRNAERMFHIDQFLRDPGPFFDFSREMARLVKDIRPTFTHRFLAELEGRGLLQAVITQNVDALHHLAGSKNVVAVHGSYATGRCLACGRAYGYEDLLARLAAEDVPRCDCPDRGVIKPDVVLFGEPVKDLPRAVQLARACDLMLVLGSSLRVAPAAMLPEMTSGTVVVVALGPIGLPPGPGRYFVHEDLDAYFRAVAACLSP